ncbi:MAG: dCMP deaminase family protein [Candidatus Altiarchaeota archaeon]|nr:dCMP deaminase family protein [Candidatus Altiarchaeota archaeon]
MVVKRPQKNVYYLEIAKAIAQRSPCSRRQFGAIIVVNDAIVSTGYNGPARGVDNCDLGCLKDKKKVEEFTGYEWCPAVHAEENAIINAARNGSVVNEGILYILGQRADGTVTESHPCKRCARVVVNAGIERVVTMNSLGEIISFRPQDFVHTDNEWYRENMKK